MIDQLYDLACAIESTGVLEEVSSHSDIKSLAKNESLLFLLNNDSTVDEIVYVKPETTQSFWKHTKGNFSAFPVIRVQNPLLDRNESDKIEEQWNSTSNLDEKKALLLSLNFENINEECTDIICSDYTVDSLTPITHSNPKLESLQKLIFLFPKNQQEQINFIKNITVKIKECISAADDKMCKAFKVLLCGKYTKKNVYKSLFFTAFDMKDYSPHVLSPETRLNVIKALNEQILNNSNAVKDVCMLTGNYESIVTERFPAPTLPVIGNLILYSNNKTIKCLERYGKSGVTSFPVSIRAATTINNALQWITQPAFKNITWCPITGNVLDSPSLMILYIDGLNEQIPLAELFTNDLSDEENFTQICKTIFNGCEMLGSVPVRMAVIDSIDAGRNKLVLYNTTDTLSLCNMINQWKLSFTNHPDISTEYHFGREDMNEYITPIYKIINFYKCFYSINGDKSKKEISSFDLTELFNVFLSRNVDVYTESDNKLKYQLMLNKIIEKVFTVFSYVTLTKQTYRKCKSGCIDAFFTSISILSFLLYYLDKGINDMEQSYAFHYGKLLNLCDDLQRKYYVDERNGGDKNKPIPNQLIGNTVYGECFYNPLGGFNRLMEKMRFYFSWAQTTKKSPYAKLTLSLIRTEIDYLSQRTLPTKFNDIEKAELSFGYISSINNKKSDKEQGE